MKHSLLSIVLLSGLITALMTGGCDESESSEQAAVETEASDEVPPNEAPPEEAVGPSNAAEGSTAAFIGLQAAYTSLADALASDNVESTKTAAVILATASGALIEGSEHPENLTTLRDASAGMSQDD